MRVRRVALARRVDNQPHRTASGNQSADRRRRTHRTTTATWTTRTTRISAVSAALAVLAVVGVTAVPASAGTSQRATADVPVTHDVVVKPDPQDNTPHVLDGRTQAVADLGDRVLIAGKFTKVKLSASETTYDRTNLFAYDPATGAVDETFDPAPDGLVTSLVAASDSDVFVAGQFSHVAGSYARGVAKIDSVTGAVDQTFDANTNGMVYDMHRVGDLLYIAGTFTKVGDVGRMNFAIVDATTGAVLGNSLAFADGDVGLTRVERFDVTPDGSHLVAIGNFTRVGNAFRQNIAVLNLDGATATVSPWRTDVYRAGQCNERDYLDTWTRDVDVSPDGTYFIVVAIGGWHGTDTFCDTAVRWELSDIGPATPTWRNDTGGDSITAVVSTGEAIYIGGHFKYVNNSLRGDGPIRGPGSVARNGIAALDPTNGLPLSFDPARERGLRVWRLVPTTAGLYVLSDSSMFAGEWHPRLTFLPTAGGAVPNTPVAATTPASVHYATGKKLRKRTYDGHAFGAQTLVDAPASWKKARGVIPATDATYRFLKSGKIQRSEPDGTWTRVRTWLPDIGTFQAAAYVPQASAAGRLVYTVKGDPNLYARGFGVDKGVVSTLGTVLSGPHVDGRSWAPVRSLAVIDGALYATNTAGQLTRTPFDGMDLDTAHTVAISGPSIDGISWRKARALFAVD